jgi:superfamily II DNA or RNA helicase
MTYSYLYLRQNESGDLHNAYKLGITTQIIERKNTYISGEVVPGEYISVFKILNKNLEVLEYDLICYLKQHNYHIYKDGGTEFFSKEIINIIEPYLQDNFVKYIKLTDDEIYNIKRKRRQYTKLCNIMKIYKLKRMSMINRAFNTIRRYNIIIPNRHQQNVLNNIEHFYIQYDIGKILWTCGLGKALLSILIVKQLKFKKICIGTSSKYLQRQLINEILKIFPNEANILMVGGDNYKNVYATTNIDVITKFQNNRLLNKPIFIVTTYNSCNKLNNVKFDFKIGDEAHHLVGELNSDITNTYNRFHTIISNKTLFMTATQKVIDIKSKNIYSMDDESKFGIEIDSKTTNWAICNKHITDILVLVLKNTDEQVNQIIRNINQQICNVDLFISTYMSLKSIEKYDNLSHILIYANTTQHADLINTYINKIIELRLIKIDKKYIYNNSLHSNENIDFEEELNKFKNSPYGIISCCYIFGEGFDCSKINGVCIAESMISNTRIIQSILRPNRLEKGNPDKIAYVILPYIDTDDYMQYFLNSYMKVKTIISNLRNIDDNIETKIKLACLQEVVQYDDNDTRRETNNQYDLDDFDNDNGLATLKLRLKHSKSLHSNFTEEEDEYNYYRDNNKVLGIKSKDEYHKLKDKNSRFYISNPHEYFRTNCVWKNWYHFLGYDTSLFIQCKGQWKKRCNELNIKSLDDYNKISNEHIELPINPSDFYTNFIDIPFELEFKTKRR